MSKKELVKRYAIFVVSLAVNSLGAVVITKAAMGASPNVSIAFSLSLIIPAVSFGTWTFLYSCFKVLLQVAILRKNTKVFDLVLQCVFAWIFGNFVDFFNLLLSGFAPTSYVARLACLLVGCLIAAFGVYLEVIADVVMLATEAIVRLISKLVNKEFGSVKIAIDVIQVTVAAALCLIFLHQLSGVREGTIIVALLMGTCVRFFTRKLSWFTRILLPESNKPVAG